MHKLFRFLKQLSRLDGYSTVKIKFVIMFVIIVQINALEGLKILLCDFLNNKQINSFNHTWSRASHTENTNNIDR